jgi:delta-1-pyrroline-5-carboxylate synthetase
MTLENHNMLLMIICSHQVKELMSEGIEVILVTSGAVGIGLQKLRHQRLLNSRWVSVYPFYLLFWFNFHCQPFLSSLSSRIWCSNSAVAAFTVRKVMTLLPYHVMFWWRSFMDLEKPQIELDGKPCAAVGQSGLMALYDSLFTQVLIDCYGTSAHLWRWAAILLVFNALVG